MELTIIGCSGSLSGPDSPASSYLVQAPYAGRTFSLVVDLGPGSAGALFSVLDPATIDAIAISHLHPDHCLDLTGFHVASRYAPDAPWPQIPLYGPPGTLDRLGRAYDPSPDGTEPDDLTASFSFQAWESQQQVGPFVITTSRLAHPVPMYGMRIAGDDAVLTYSGDTGPCGELIDLARDADLLLCESAFREGADNQKDVHLTGKQAAEHAAKAGVGALMITHIPPWHDHDRVLAEARPHFDGPITLARRGERHRVG
jgi:ribonuclease BN (tRNA processing enzyme)